MTKRLQRFGCIARLGLGSSNAWLALAFAFGIGVAASPLARAQGYEEQTLYTFTDTPQTVRALGQV